ncbi:hypothetical protein CYLTODRAFT_23648 [Cylindrobasidium torrendii FP15055 ss-10]|uniref:Uncharacterized protein n=1 Tax=Cylindrobasidium torrendii FP15055 ss-10 TaxID=1314674 RepID=A0A0D7ATA5_9AGAR|nr:hypothetical protein CYLTODRAFT_23648 [Cylindrobasidium torrendii FP15055 ss-10]
MRYLFGGDFFSRTPDDAWFPHGRIPYDSPFEEDALDTLIYFYHLFEYETFLRQVDATDGPRILRLLSMLWNPLLATHFFNALNVPGNRCGESRFFEYCTDMMRPRRWAECQAAIEAKFGQLRAADNGTRNRLGRLGFPVEACADNVLGLPPFLPAVGKVY